MKVVIVQDMKKLGKIGKTVEVKDGYARNYLIPGGFALPATKENFQKLEELKKRENKRVEGQKKKVLGLKKKIEEISLTMISEVKEDEEIYGSIGEPQILKSLKDEGIEIEKGALVLESPIKKLGVYNISITLHPEVVANLRVWVVKK